MVLDALKFNPQVQNNPFTSKVAFTGSDYEPTSAATQTNYGTGKGINAESSTGVIGEVTGTGENGKHRLNTYF